MATLFYDISQANVTARVRNALAGYRDAMKPVEDAYNFLQGFSISDLVALGFTTTDATDIKTAVADAHEEVILHAGGALGSYTLPYNFSAAQNRVIGP
jgi:hypothetical protein